MVDKEKIADLFWEYFTTNGRISIDDAGKVNIDDSVRCRRNMVMPLFLFEFGRVHGDFNCSNMGLTSLKGCPSSVGRDFYCKNNPLQDFQGGPSTVGGSFDFRSVSVKLLQGFPSYIGIRVYCDYNPDLPLLRLLAAKHGVNLNNPGKYPFVEKIQEVLNQFEGQGKRGAMACSMALLTLEKELGIDIRANIRW